MHGKNLIVGFTIVCPLVFGSSHSAAFVRVPVARREGGIISTRCRGRVGGGRKQSIPPCVSSARRRSRVAMRVEVDVKEGKKAAEGTGGSSSLGDSSSSSAPTVPKDHFHHTSLVDVPTDYGPYAKVGKYQINAFGVYYALMTLLWTLPWVLVLVIQSTFIKFFDKWDPMRSNVDIGCATWGWLCCASSSLLPEVTGAENMPEGAAVYVANHASWMDVPYAAFLPHRPKYLAKSDLGKVPILGNAMRLANHVLLDRDDKRSQMEALKRALDILRGGTSVFVFPEGTRGPQGRLQPFKMGAFKVAAKAGVPVVPVSISGTHLVMPREVVMPQRNGLGVTGVHVHPAIDSKGLTDKELADACFEVINEALSDPQKYIPPPPLPEKKSSKEEKAQH